MAIWYDFEISWKGVLFLNIALQYLQTALLEDHDSSGWLIQKYFYRSAQNFHVPELVILGKLFCSWWFFYNCHIIFNIIEEWDWIRSQTIFKSASYDLVWVKMLFTDYSITVKFNSSSIIKYRLPLFTKTIKWNQEKYLNNNVDQKNGKYPLQQKYYPKYRKLSSDSPQTKQYFCFFS